MDDMKPSEYHGCFTGDCPHEDVNDCIASLASFCDERHVENRRLREALRTIARSSGNRPDWQIAKEALKGE